MDWYNPMPSKVFESEHQQLQNTDVDVTPVAEGLDPPDAVWTTWAGDKYHGGFGETNVFDLDYWTLRARSGQLFRSNIYARGILRRLVTNEINTGLSLEAQPNEMLLGLPEDSLSDWTDLVEEKFQLYADNKNACDFKGVKTFGELQRAILLEALIEGDVLLILHINPITKLPYLQVISGSHVETPAEEVPLKAGESVEYGVHLDKDKRHLGYWVTQAKEAEVVSRYVPAYGNQTGRRVAWLFYGLDRRLDDVRGEPLLSILLQSLKELDRYRDAALRKATINAILALWVEKTQDKMGTLPVTGGATKKTQITPTSTEAQRKFSLLEHQPGVVYEELATGEKVQAHSISGTDVNYGVFEEAIIQAIAWVMEIPPETLKLSFSRAYSASQAARNEFKLYLNMRRSIHAAHICKPVYEEWLISQVLLKQVKAPGMLDAYRDPMQWETFSAWTVSEWSGVIKPSTELVKEVKGYQGLVGEGWATNDRASRELTGTKFSKNIKRVGKENQMKVDALKPLLELEKSVGPERAAELLKVVS